MMITILGYLFLGIFALTAILTLASLPGWIEIPDQYRKVLFRALLLEVVGAIIILFTNSYINPEPTSLQYEVSPQNWVAFSTDSGQVIQPKIIVSGVGDPLNVTLGRKLQAGNLLFNNNNSRGALTEEGLVLENLNNGKLGVIPPNTLTSLGLFNTIKSNDGIIPSSSNYKLIKFMRTANGRWERRGSFIKDCPYILRIVDDQTGTHYQILLEESDELVYDSNESSGEPFNTDQRMIHFYEHDNNFYLFRITEADLITKNYVHLLQIKLEPGVE